MIEHEHVQKCDEPMWVLSLAFPLCNAVYM